MAKERNLPQKATMTTSDYIRVVGSDNASYKQSMNSVMGAMGVYPLTVGYTNPQVSAFSELKDSGFYTIGTASNYSDAPANTYGFLAVYKGGSYATQTYYALGTSDTYFRFSTNNGSTWSAWTREPTRAEIDALNSKTVLTQSISVTPNGSATVTLPSVSGSFLCVWRGTNAVWRGLALITKASNSDGIATVITSNMGTVTESGNTLTFTNLHSTSSQTYYIEVNRIGN